MAKGAGQGQGGGEGRGETTGENVAAGSGVAVVFTVIMCMCGIPMIIVGAVLVQVNETYVIRSVFSFIYFFVLLLLIYNNNVIYLALLIY